MLISLMAATIVLEQIDQKFELGKRISLTMCIGGRTSCVYSGKKLDICKVHRPIALEVTMCIILYC